MTIDRLYAVIMAGGRGTRFWPLSRRAKPKQLLSLIGDTPLLRQSVDRMLDIVPIDRIYVVTAKSHADGVRDILSDLPAENILVEPEGKSTAPAIALAAVHILEKDRDAIMAVIPSDHVIGRNERLQVEMLSAAEAADRENLLLTFGIRPNRPETGYGYIEVGAKLDKNVFGVASFKEKPNAKKAKDYLNTGRYLWNSGMFVFRCDTIIEKIREHLPELYLSWEKYRNSAKQAEDLQSFYSSISPISIDYGVMEKSSDSAGVIGATFTWSDVGSWEAIDEVWEPDDMDNRKNFCRVVSIASQDNTVLSRKLVALVGVEDMIIVETDDALLVCKKDRSQEIKSLVEEIERQGLQEYL